MPEVDGNTLVMAIQAVDDKLRALETARELVGAEAAGDYDEELLAFDRAARKLEIAYEQALRSASNLPSYARLVGRDSGR